jgi:hypothetical protein
MVRLIKGYGAETNEQFAFLVPLLLAPIIIALMWAQHQARRYERIYRHTEDRCVFSQDTPTTLMTDHGRQHVKKH